MINDFIENKINKATFKTLDDGTCYGEIKSCRGVWATGNNLESCKSELREVLEEWLLLQVYSREKIPNFDFFKTKLPVYA